LLDLLDPRKHSVGGLQIRCASAKDGWRRRWPGGINLVPILH